MAKVRIENIDGGLSSKDREAQRKERTALTEDEKKLPQEQQRQIIAQREAQYKAEQKKAVGDTLQVVINEQQYNAQTGGDQPRQVDFKTLEPGESADFDITDKKSISVQHV